MSATFRRKQERNLVIARPRLLAAGLSTLLVVGCATVAPPPVHKGESSYRLVSEADTVRYPLPRGVTAHGARLLANPAPIYPAALLARCPAPVELRAQVIVGVHGKVDEVRFPSVGTVDPAYLAAVRGAAMRWLFEPLVFQHWAADTNGNRHPLDSVTKPFSLTFVFRFACRDGKPQTGSSVATETP